MNICSYGEEALMKGNAKIVILRGNSGSGKTTVVKKLQKRLGHGTLLI